DVRGKIVVALDGTVRGLRSDIAVHLEAAKQRTAAAKGALGFIAIARVGADDARQPVVQSLSADGKGVDSAAMLAVDMTVSPDAAERLFKGAPRRLSEIRSGSARDRPLRGFALPGELAVQTRGDWHDFTSPQVIGVIPGSDPALRGEYVVLMAHLDHLGRDSGAKGGEDGIFNGALDNAAGVATLLEAARAFIASGTPPRRSVMLVATAGEERGLLGAYHLASHPPVPADRIVAVINLDMPLLTYDFTDVIAFGAEHSTIVDTVEAAGRSLGVAVSPDPMPEQNLFIRSDHYPFVLRGVPSIFLMTGYANGGRQAWNHFLTRIYHRPNDDLRQPIRWAAGARFAALNYRIALKLADQDQRPVWRPGDYFGARLPVVPLALPPVQPPR
ncbi:MAG: M20/M25/M40 family metallo-hydrolase, partial [Sphingomicrobium sp.]